MGGRGGKMSSPGYLYCVYRKMFLDHPNQGNNPQGYCEHGMFSIWNSTKLIFFGLLGIIHGILPCVFKFSTSSAVIRSFRTLVLSRRHKEELRKYISKQDIEKLTEQSRKE